MNRRRFLGYTAAGAIGIAAGDSVIEPRRLAITNHRVAIGGSIDPVAVKLVHITDLHLPIFSHHEEAVTRATHEARPDIIAITGDSIDTKHGLPPLAKFLSALDPEIPKFAVLGNWDYWSHIDIRLIEREYSKHNCRLLVNRAAVLETRGRRLRLVGLDDLLVGHPDPAAAFSDDTSKVDAEIILAHCPQHRDIVRSSSSLMLSGHTHGGQVSFFGYAPVVPRGSGDYVRGWYGTHSPAQSGATIDLRMLPSSANVRSGRPLYVSRGLGNSILPLRFCSIPELAVFDLLV